ncbi:MAG TPA: hypothetical protein VNI52_04245 [Sphingobacteriaceae bacterium]|nr:hypothetical protein [Sphingobacteriaceae bacterium]
MKPIHLITLAVLFLFSSCKKSEIKSSDLNGEWKLTSNYGGMMPASTPLMDIKLIISGSDYQVFNQGKLSHTTKFKMVNVAETIDDYKYSYKLDFEDSQMIDRYFSIDNNQLRMQSGTIALDHVVQFYKRK